MCALASSVVVVVMSSSSLLAEGVAVFVVLLLELWCVFVMQVESSRRAVKSVSQQQRRPSVLVAFLAQAQHLRFLPNLRRQGSRSARAAVRARANELLLGRAERGERIGSVGATGKNTRSRGKRVRRGYGVPMRGGGRDVCPCAVTPRRIEHTIFGGSILGAVKGIDAGRAGDETENARKEVIAMFLSFLLRCRGRGGGNSLLARRGREELGRYGANGRSGEGVEGLLRGRRGGSGPSGPLAAGLGGERTR